MTITAHVRQVYIEDQAAWNDRSGPLQELARRGKRSDIALRPLEMRLECLPDADVVVHDEDDGVVVRRNG